MRTSQTKVAAKQLHPHVLVVSQPVTLPPPSNVTHKTRYVLFDSNVTEHGSILRLAAATQPELISNGYFRQSSYSSSFKTTIVCRVHGWRAWFHAQKVTFSSSVESRSAFTFSYILMSQGPAAEMADTRVPCQNRDLTRKRGDSFLYCVQT